jgi:hypothetical protein
VTDSARGTFATVIQALAPYSSEIVFIGGWVHALYLAEVGAGESAVGTTDIDVAIPRHLPAGARPTVLELVTGVGFDAMTYVEGGPLSVWRQGDDGVLIDLDLLTEATSPDEVITIDGQPDLVVQGYPGQRMLLDNAEWMEVGAALDPSLVPSVRIRVPTLPVYVLHKGLASMQRAFPEKRAKDLVYLYEIVRHPVLGPRARDGLEELRRRYPSEFEVWRIYLAGVCGHEALLRDVVAQLIASGWRGGPSAARASIVAWLRRILGDDAGVV